ncbi:MAG: cytochrome c peroxidase [Bacteroidales bacterium]
MAGIFRSIIFIILALLLTALFSCSKKSDDTPPAPVYNPTPYELEIPEGFPDMDIPDDNPMTIEGVALGRRLFYDTLLSGNYTQSCASCHAQPFAFTDHNKQFSTGIDGLEGNRNTMAVINAGWLPALFWDGRQSSLEDQALEPVPNPIEMHLSWNEAVARLLNHPEYRSLFFDAFGTQTVDSVLVVKAIAQFERTMISANSKYDLYLRGEIQLSLAETKGFEIFFTEKGDCFHCHGTILFTDQLFHNNGLDTEFPDPGRFGVTNNPKDLGLFRTPTLRNIEMTAPYMHDGRFATLQEVVDFYSHHVQPSATIDPLMKKVNQGGIQLTEDEKEYLIAFLKTLTDTSFIHDSRFSSPF